MANIYCREYFVCFLKGILQSSTRIFYTEYDSKQMYKKSDQKP